MKKRLKNLLLLSVACGSFSALYAETILAQSCYEWVGPPGVLRFGAGPVEKCNIDGLWGSPIIGAFYNDTFGRNEQVRKAYKKAGREAKRAYKDGVRCVNKLLQNGEIDNEAADDHIYHLETEFEDLQATWEDWYEKNYGQICHR